MMKTIILLLNVTKKHNDGEMMVELKTTACYAMKYTFWYGNLISASKSHGDALIKRKPTAHHEGCNWIKSVLLLLQPLCESRI